MHFSGFQRGQVAFFKQLAAKQDREWFKQNKDRYLTLAERPMKDLLDDLQPKLARQYQGFALAPPKHFRIYRDVRFSKDKSPFKTHVAAMIGLRGGEEEGAPAALYVHLGLQDFAGAGHWHLPSDKLERYRKLVGNDKTGRELQKRVEALKKKGFKLDSFEATKRVPSGFPPDHPRAGLLKLKGLGISFPSIPAAVRFSPRLATWLAARSAEAAALVTWLERRL
ncbi:MAG TPA: DUF2461 domain-containing protein [Myxococcales bacterium]|nr:DUF2461 domain-containing protein [Myxococcales bacterium]